MPSSLPASGLFLSNWWALLHLCIRIMDVSYTYLGTQVPVDPDPAGRLLRRLGSSGYGGDKMICAEVHGLVGEKLQEKEKNKELYMWTLYGV